MTVPSANLAIVIIYAFLAGLIVERMRNNRRKYRKEKLWHFLKFEELLPNDYFNNRRKFRRWFNKMPYLRDV